MSIRYLIIKLLDQFEQTDSYADVLLEQTFQKHKITEKNKSLIQEIFFGVIRWRKRLDWIIHQLYHGNLQKSPRFIKHILQISLYQIIYLQRIPTYAVINEAVDIAKAKGGHHWAGKINAILRSFQRKKDQIAFPDKNQNPVNFISVQYSFPEWLVKKWLARWGIEQTIKLCKAANSRPELSLRVNQLKISRDQFKKILFNSNILAKQSAYNEFFFKTDQLPNLSQFQPFKQGYFSIQDESAGLACQLVKPEPGEHIIDICSAPGGKTTYLSELSKGKAIVISVDKNFSRLKLIKQNLIRLKLKSNRLIQADGSFFTAKKVNKILLDVPCSGLGVVAKRVDLRWKRTPSQIKQLSEIQFQLLKNAAQMIKLDGVIVYSTCTIEPEENEQVVEKFLLENKQFKIDPAQNYVSENFTTAEGYIYTFPHRHGIDGSFAVRLVNRG